MKRILLLSTLVGLFLMSFITVNQSKDEVGIKFYQGTWNQVVTKAKQENKLIFVDCYATWCGPCKAMSKKIFTKDEIGSFFNQEFINYKLNMETPQGREFAKKFGKEEPIRGYPTMFFIDGDEKIKHRIIGKHNASQLLMEGKKAVNKIRKGIY